MDKSIILAKIKTLHKEYVSYSEYLEKFNEEVDDKKKEVATNLESKDFEKNLEDFVLEYFVLRSVYASDLDIIMDKILTYINVARLLGFDQEVPEEILELAVKNKKKEIKPTFIITSGKPVEVNEGFVDEQRKQIKEHGNLSKLIQRATR
jgi:hypothetical protein